MDDERYQIRDGSLSYHCCFQYTIVDTTKKDDEDDYILCECFGKEDADQICNSLNFHRLMTKH